MTVHGQSLRTIWFGLECVKCLGYHRQHYVSCVNMSVIPGQVIVLMEVSQSGSKLGEARGLVWIQTASRDPCHYSPLVQIDVL